MASVVRHPQGMEVLAHTLMAPGGHKVQEGDGITMSKGLATRDGLLEVMVEASTGLAKNTSTTHGEVRLPNCRVPPKSR